jgi:hypothetical protein
MVDNLDYTLPVCPSSSNSSSLELDFYAQDVEHAIISLSPEQPFVHFPLGLTQSDLELLGQLRTPFYEAYDNFDKNGDLEDLYSEVKVLIEGLSLENKDISEQAANIISSLINSAIKASPQADSALVTIRAIPATDKEYEPSWHKDPCFMKQEDSECLHRNIVFTLKGPATIIYPASAQEMKEYAFINQYDYDENKTIKLAEKFDLSTVSSANLGEGTAFLMGGKHGAIHSAPHLTEDRLFISIIPGNNKTLEMQNDKVYP